MDDAMDIDEEESDGEECRLIPLQSCILPCDLLVTIIDHGNEVQSHWAAIPLMRCLFRTSSTEKLTMAFKSKSLEIVEVHKTMWPGFEPPKVLESKHAAGTEAEQVIFLKQTSISISLAVSWMVWSISKTARMKEDIERCQTFLRTLLDHCLDIAGELEFKVKRVGTRDEMDSIARVTKFNPYFDSDSLWTSATGMRIAAAWERSRISEHIPVTSRCTAPQWVDLILFALQPKSSKESLLLKPLVLSILPQLTYRMDENMARLAISVEEFQRSKHKNQLQSTAANRLAMVDAAIFILHENDAC